MQLKEWRKKKRLTQIQLARALEIYVREQKGVRKALTQSTLGYWERGTLPRKWWLSVISDFTKGHVGADDFVDTEPPESSVSPVDQVLPNGA